METWLRHLHRRDLRFIAFVLANLLCIACYLFAHVQPIEQETVGWRRIDLEAVMNRIETGDLLRHEAAWYHTKQEVGRNPVPDVP